MVRVGELSDISGTVHDCFDVSTDRHPEGCSEWCSAGNVQNAVLCRESQV